MPNILDVKPQIVLDNYGYINARVRAMKSVLLDAEFYEELLKQTDFSALMNSLEKTPYKSEIQECAISHSGVEGIDEALKRNLSRTFRKILSFTGGEARKLIIVLLGRWDLQNIITILRGINIQASQDQILESLIPAGELEMPLLSQLADEKTVKGVIDVLATWRSPYARVLNEKYAEYIEEKDLAILELALGKTYYTNALQELTGLNSDQKIAKNILINEIDALNITTILRLQKMNLDELIQKKKQENNEKKEEKAGPTNFYQKIKDSWHKMFEPLEEEKTESVKYSKVKRFYKNSEKLAKVKVNEYKKSREILYQKISEEKNVFKKIWMYLNSPFIEYKKSKNKSKAKDKNLKDILNDGKQIFKDIQNLIVKAKKVEQSADKEAQKLKQIEHELRRARLSEFYIPGGKEITQEQFVTLCLNFDVEKVINDLEKTSYGEILKNILNRYLEYNTLSVFERKLEEKIIKKGISAYNIDPLSVGIPIGYIWKKYNEVVNLRIIVRCKKIGMPERKIKEELIMF